MWSTRSWFPLNNFNFGVVNFFGIFANVISVERWEAVRALTKSLLVASQDHAVVLPFQLTFGWSRHLLLKLSILTGPFLLRMLVVPSQFFIPNSFFYPCHYDWLAPRGALFVLNTPFRSFLTYPTLFLHLPSLRHDASCGHFLEALPPLVYLQQLSLDFFFLPSCFLHAGICERTILFP